ncbi:PREDICTED: complexin-1 [Condylura cristata]|uniref:complexin-1 n=1 Tax=Condylura cristata TaxID=143302 RepID=UPI00064373CD|nr:PREDICTED: complexin-1 [Condylura cristata]
MGAETGRDGRRDGETETQRRGETETRRRGETDADRRHPFSAQPRGLGAVALARRGALGCGVGWGPAVRGGCSCGRCRRHLGLCPALRPRSRPSSPCFPSRSSRQAHLASAPSGATPLPRVLPALTQPRPRPPQYGIKKKEEREAEAQAAMEANSEGSLTRPKKAIPPGCGDEPEEEDESILDTVIKYLPGPLQDMFKK